MAEPLDQLDDKTRITLQCYGFANSELVAGRLSDMEKLVRENEHAAGVEVIADLIAKFKYTELNDQAPITLSGDGPL